MTAMGGSVDGGYLDVGQRTEDVGFGQIWAITRWRGIQCLGKDEIVGVPYGGRTGCHLGSYPHRALYDPASA